MDQAVAAAAAINPLPGTFIGLGLDLKSDKLYDLGGAILDVMGLWAMQPKAAVVKVMSVPDSCCVRVVVPDDHLPNRFHEILIHDMEDEEPQFVALSELGCLRLDWPRALFTFMGRYQFELDQMRKECRDRFGSTQSGSCTTCVKYIQQNLGRHVALYHMELAQLWRCPLTWCTVWKGTPQDCIDHMRRAHDIPPLVKAANLARWFPPWTVTREQWSSLTQLAVSGKAVDTLWISRIGVPLFHRYRIFDRSGTHVVSVVRTCNGCVLFLRNLMLHRCELVIVAALGKLQHRCRGQHCRTQVVGRRTSLLDPVHLVDLAHSLAVAVTSVAPGVVRSNRSNQRAVPALMDLALPRFACPEGRSARPHLPWIVTTDGSP